MARRSTKHRQAILAAFTAEHLLSAKELRQAIPAADPSTIYRNIKRLVNDEVLRVVETGEATKYELADKHAAHDHFICSNCNEVKAIYLKTDQLTSQLPTNGDISVTVRGICNNCN